MPSTYTGSLRIQKMADGEQNSTWGDVTNLNMDLLDAAIAGSSTVSLNGLTSVTLTAVNGNTDQSRAPLIYFTGTPAGAVTCTVPACAKTTKFVNLTSYNVTLTTNLGGTTFVLGPTSSANIFCDSTNVTLDDRTAAITMPAINIYQNATQTFSGGAAYYAYQLNTAFFGGSIFSNLAYSFMASGNVIGNIFYATSDRRKKDKISPLPRGIANDIDKLASLSCSFRMTEDGTYRWGWIAQDLAKHGMMDMVSIVADPLMKATTDEDGFKSPSGGKFVIDESKIIVRLVHAVADLRAKVDRKPLWRRLLGG